MIKKTLSFYKTYKWYYVSILLSSNNDNLNNVVGAFILKGITVTRTSNISHVFVISTGKIVPQWGISKNRLLFLFHKNNVSSCIIYIGPETEWEKNIVKHEITFI